MNHNGGGKAKGGEISRMRVFFTLLWVVILSSCAKEKYQLTFDEVYHQSFDDFGFLKYEEWDQETNTFEKKPKMAVNPGAENYPKIISYPRLAIDNTKKSNSLKISVLEHDQVYMSLGKNDTRSRAEIIFKPQHASKSTYYYSWMVYIPNDSTFQDIESADGMFHIIAQWHQANDNAFPYSGTQPPFKLSYKHEPNAPDDYRNLALNYGTHYNNKSSELRDPLRPVKKSFQIADAIKKGEWVKITTGFHWAADETGYMQMWINDYPCVLEGPEGQQELRVVKSESALNATKIYGPNLYITKKTNSTYPEMPAPNYFKFGHYRGKIKGAHTLYIDDFTVSTNMRMSVDKM